MLLIINRYCYKEFVCLSMFIRIEVEVCITSELLSKKFGINVVFCKFIKRKLVLIEANLSFYVIMNY
jgi:hypothetical protein